MRSFKFSQAHSLPVATDFDILSQLLAQFSSTSDTYQIEVRSRSIVGGHSDSPATKDAAYQQFDQRRVLDPIQLQLIGPAREHARCHSNPLSGDFVHSDSDEKLLHQCVDDSNSSNYPQRNPDRSRAQK